MKQVAQRAGLVLILASGCGTIAAQTPQDKGVYSGVILHLREILCYREQPEQIWHAGDMDFFGPLKLIFFADLPLSFVADTLSLPLTAFTEPGWRRVLWATHPRTGARTSCDIEKPASADTGPAAEARATRSSIDTGRFRLERRAFKITDECLRQNYPFVERRLARDLQNRVRFYQSTQIISHGERMTIEHYYDENGTQRFIILRGGIANTLGVALGSDGKPEWVLDDGIEVPTSTLDEFVLKPASAAEAEAEYMREQPGCPLESGST